MKITWHAAAITPIIIFISSMLRRQENVSTKISYTCTQHGFWIVSVKHVVLFCYGYVCIYACVHTYIHYHNIEQWCISTRPCGLKRGLLDRRCFPEIHTTEREEIVLKNTTVGVDEMSCAWSLNVGTFVQMMLRKYTNNVLLITERICSFRNLFQFVVNGCRNRLWLLEK